MEKSVNNKLGIKTKIFKKESLKISKLELKLILLLILVGVLFFIALFGIKIVPHNPYDQNLAKALCPPNNEYIFGTDRYGRCMFSRIIVGAKTTIFSALVLVLIISFIGTILGTLCGYFGGKIDNIIMRIADIFLAFPGMVLAIAVAGVLGGGIMNAIISLVIVCWPKYCRLSRGLVLTVKNNVYIQAARISGCSDLKIIFKHILPNIIGQIIITATLDLGVMMMELAGLSFLGLGAMPPTPEWGSMINDGRSMIQLSPWVVFAPGGAIFVTVIIFNLLGDTIRDYFDFNNKI